MSSPNHPHRQSKQRNRIHPPSTHLLTSPPRPSKRDETETETAPQQATQPNTHTRLTPRSAPRTDIRAPPRPARQPQAHRAARRNSPLPGPKQPLARIQRPTLACPNRDVRTRIHSTREPSRQEAGARPVSTRIGRRAFRVARRCSAATRRCVRADSVQRVDTRQGTLCNERRNQYHPR